MRTGAVFLGEVTAKEQTSTWRVTATLQVERIWKGEVAETLDVDTSPGGGSCGVSFLPGERYLVFAYARSAVKDGESSLGTSICSPTRLLHPDAEIEALFDQLPLSIEPFTVRPGVEVPLEDAAPEMIIERISSPNDAERVQALAALPARLDALEEAVPRLLALLDPEEAATQDRLFRLHVRQTLQRLGPDAAPLLDALLPALADPQTSQDVLPILQAMGSAAAPATSALIDLLIVDGAIVLLEKEKDQARTANEAYQIDHQIDNLKKLPSDVARVLGAIGEAANAAQQPLWDGLHAGRLPASAAPVLIAIGGDADAVATYLAAEARHEDPARRAAAVEGLKEIGDESTLPLLLEALGDEDVEIQSRVVAALARFGADAAEAVPIMLEVSSRFWDDVLSRTLNRIAPEAPEVVETIAEYLLRDDEADRLASQLAWTPLADRLLPHVERAGDDVDEARVAALLEQLNRKARAERQARADAENAKLRAEEPRSRLTEEQIEAMIAERDAAAAQAKQKLETAFAELVSIVPKKSPRTGESWPENLRLAIGNPEDPLRALKSEATGYFQGSQFNSVAVPDGAVAVGDLFGDVFVFDDEDGALRRRIIDPVIVDHEDERAGAISHETLFGAQIAALGDTLYVSAYHDGAIPYQAGMIYFYDAVSGEERKRLTSPNPKSNELFGEIFQARDERLLVAATKDRSWPDSVGALYLFDADGELLLSLPHPAPERCEDLSQAAFTLIGQEGIAYFQSHCMERPILLRQSDGEQIAVLDAPERSDDGFGCAFESVDGSLIVADCGGAAIDLFDPATGAHRDRLSLSHDLPRDPEISLAAYGEHRLLIGAVGSGSVDVFDLRSGERVARYAAPNAAMPGMPAGVELTRFGAALASRDGEIVVLAPSDALSPSGPMDFTGGGAVYLFRGPE